MVIEAIKLVRELVGLIRDVLGACGGVPRRRGGCHFYTPKHRRRRAGDVTPARFGQRAPLCPDCFSAPSLPYPLAFSARLSRYVSSAVKATANATPIRLS